MVEIDVILKSIDIVYSLKTLFFARNFDKRSLLAFKNIIVLFGRNNISINNNGYNIFFLLFDLYLKMLSVYNHFYYNLTFKDFY